MAKFFKLAAQMSKVKFILEYGTSERSVFFLSMMKLMAVGH